jgi:autotransporter-associated beta strand protein
MKAPKYIRNFALATSIAALLAAQTSQAAILYWDNSGGTANDWGSLANWSTVIGGGTNPLALPGAEDVATFSATTIQGTANTINLNADRSVLGLEFLSGVTNSTTFANGSGTRILTIGTSGIVNNGSGAVTFNSGSVTPASTGIILAGSQSITNNGSGLITFTNRIAGSGSPTITNNGTGTGTVRLSAGTLSSVTKVIQNSATSKLELGGSFNSDLEVTAGTVELVGQSVIPTGSILVNGGLFTILTNNNFVTTGNLSVSSGTLRLGNGTNSAASLAILGGTINLTGTTSTHNLTVTSLTLSGNATFTAGTPQIAASNVAISGGNLTGTGILSIGSGGLTTTNTTSASVTKVNISGSQSWANNGTAEFAILGAITASGTTPTLTNNGTGSGSVRIATALPNTVSSVVQNSATSTLVLSGANLYTGRTTISAGTLRAGAAASQTAFGTGSAVSIANTSGATLDLNNFSQTIGSLAGGGALGGNVTLGANATLTTGSNHTSTTFGGIISGTGTSGLSKNGRGTLTLTGANTYTGTTTINGGALAGTQTSGTPFGTGAVTLGTATTLSLAPTGSGSDVAFTGGTAVAGSLFTYNAGATLSLNKGAQNSLTYTFGGTGATTARGTNGTLILSTSNIANFGTAGSKTERFIMNGTAPTQVNTLVSGLVIQDRNTSNAGDFAAYNNTDGYTKAAYTHTNSFTSPGTTTNTSLVNITSNSGSDSSRVAYALRVDNSTLTNTDTLTLGGGATGVAGLILNNGTISGGTSLTTPTSVATELSIYTSGTSVISTPILTATSQAGISVFGPGTLDFSSSAGNTFIGGLRINNSTIIATNDNQLGGSTNQINLTGATLQTSGTFALGGAGQRAIVLAAGQDQSGGTFNVTSGTTTYQNSSTSTKILSGSGSLTKTGAGTMVLSGNTPNTYSGGTVVNAGTLQLGAANMLADAGAVTVDGGIFNIQTFSDTVGTVTLTSGSITGSSGVLTGGFYDMRSGTASAILGGGNQLTKSTSGTVTLSAANTYTGSTTVSGGTLLLDYATSNTVLSSSSALTLGGGTLQLQGRNAAFATAQTLASLSLTARTASSISLVPNGGTSTTLTITDNTVTTGAGASVNFDYTAGTTVGTTVGNNIVAWNPTLTAGIIGGTYTVTDTGGTGFATIRSSRVVRLADPGSAGLVRTTGSSSTNYFVNQNYSTSSTTTSGSLVEALTGNVAAATVTVNTTGVASGANLAMGTNKLTLTIGGGMFFSGANPYSITGATNGITSSESGRITLNNSITSPSGLSISAPITNTTATAVTFAGTGTTRLLATNSNYSGATIITGGTLEVASLAAGTAISSIGNPNSTSAGNLLLGNGTTLRFIGDGGANDTTNRNWTLNGAFAGDSATLDASGAGTETVTFSSTSSPAYGASDQTRTINLAGTNTSANTLATNIADNGIAAVSLTKSGVGTWVLTGSSTYTGQTTVSAGTLLVNGSLGNSNVSVSSGANFGGTGTLGGNLGLTSGSFFHVVDVNDSLTVTGTIDLFAGFGVDDLVGLDLSSVAAGTYTLINGTFGTGVFAGLSNNSLANAYDFGDGRSAYFQDGSLQLVVIPEPRAALLGSLGMLMLLRRRR